jgi:hypothetical protein
MSKINVYAVKWVERHPDYNFTAMVELFRNRDEAMKLVADMVDFTEIENPKILSAIEMSEFII